MVPSSVNIQVLQQSLSNFSLHQPQTTHQPSVVQATPVSQLAQQQQQHLIAHTATSDTDLLLSSSMSNLNLRTAGSVAALATSSILTSTTQTILQNTKFSDVAAMSASGTVLNQQLQQQQQQQYQQSSVPNSNQLIQQQQNNQHSIILTDQDNDETFNQKMLQLVATIPNYPLQKIVQRWCNDPKSPSESPPHCLTESLQSSPTKNSSKYCFKYVNIFFFILNLNTYIHDIGSIMAPEHVMYDVDK